MNASLNMVEGVVGILELARPKRANAYDRQLLDELAAAISALAVSSRVVIVQSAGDRAFCAGADLGQLAEATAADALHLRSQEVFEQLARAPFVSIAAVQGPAIAGGCELALACDLRVAAPAARFGLPEVRLGLVPSAGGCARLGRLIGDSRARGMILGGLEPCAEQAVQWGLVQEVAEDPRSAAKAWGDRIARADSLALQLAKQLLTPDLDASLRQERLAEALLYERRNKS